MRMAKPIPPHGRHRPPGEPSRSTLAQRLLPWLDLIGKLLAAIAAALAIWRGLG